MTTLGLCTIQFGDGFHPPKDASYDEISEHLKLTLVPGSVELPADFDYSNLGFVWEITSMDFQTNTMLIQVNFTNAIWISASSDKDQLELDLIEYQYFMPLVKQSRKLQAANSTIRTAEVKNITTS